MAVVYIPAPLRRLTGGQDRMRVAGASVGALVDAIDAAHAGFRARIVADGELLPSIAVSVDGDLITRGLDEPVRPESEVHFVPALGGGTDPVATCGASSSSAAARTTPRTRSRRRHASTSVRC